jgi:hypothetical protein
VLDLAASAKPSAESYGKARAFRDRVGDENEQYIAASHKMMAPIDTRIRRYPLRNFRPETLKQFEREWRVNMPQEFSIDLTTEWVKHGVTITETRIAVAEFHDDGWSEDYFEPEVSIGTVKVELGRMVARVMFCTSAIFSLRALAERIRWGWDNSDAALIRDIVAVGEVDPATLPEGEGFVTIPIGTEGAGWRARATEAQVGDSGRVQRVICCRSWWA